MAELVYRATRNRKEMAQAAECAINAFNTARPHYFRRIMLDDPGMTPERILVCLHDGGMVGTISIMRRVIRIGAVELEAAGLCNVGTLREYRGRGIAVRLLGMVAVFMARNRVPLSILYGGAPIYHSRGWTQLPVPTLDFELTRSRSMELGPPTRPDPAYEIREITGFTAAEKLFGLYDEYFNRINGGHIRDRAYWKFNWRGFRYENPWVWFDSDRDRFFWLAAWRDRKPVASLICRETLEKGTGRRLIAVREWCYSEVGALKSLMAAVIAGMRRRRFHAVRGRFPMPADAESMLDELGFALRRPGRIDGMWRIGDWEALWSGLEPELAARYASAGRPGFMPFSLTNRFGSVTFAPGKSGRKPLIMACQRLERDIIIEQIDLLGLITGGRSAAEIPWGAVKPGRDELALLGALFPRRGYVLWDSDHF